MGNKLDKNPQNQQFCIVFLNFTFFMQNLFRIFLACWSYFWSIIFILGSFSNFNRREFLQGFLFLIAGLLIFPKLTNSIRKFFWSKTGKYLPKFSLGIIATVLFLVGVFTSANSNQNVKKAEILGVQSSQSQSSQLSSSNSKFSSQFSSSASLSEQESSQNSEKIENLSKNSEISTQNLVKSTELSVKSPDAVETVKPQITEKSQETAEMSKNLTNLPVEIQNLAVNLAVLPVCPSKKAHKIVKK